MCRSYGFTNLAKYDSAGDVKVAPRRYSRLRVPGFDDSNGLFDGSRDKLRSAGKYGSEREFVKDVILRDFLQAADCDEFEVHHSYALGLQQ